MPDTETPVKMTIRYLWMREYRLFRHQLGAFSVRLHGEDFTHMPYLLPQTATIAG
jgi:hypothetical protein